MKEYVLAYGVSTEIMEYLLAFAFAMFLSSVLVPLFMRYSCALGLIDEPNEERKIHTESIPRCGGLGIISGFFLASFYWLDFSQEIITLGSATAIIVIFGYLDDSRDLNYRWKFAGQILATVVLISGGILFVEVPFFGMDAAPWYISYPFTLFFVLGVTNAVNLSDGLDGLAAGNSLLSMLLIALLCVQIDQIAYAIIAMAVVGGLLGFLRYNTHPAKVFMGDTGSQFLGFVTASLAIMLTQGDTSAISSMLPILILGLPILDTLHVMVIRTLAGRSMFSPDKNHIHHRLLSLGFRHYEVVAVLYSMQVTLLALAYSLRYEPDWLLFAVFFIFCASVLGFLYWGKYSGWLLRSANKAVNGKDRRSRWVRKFDWYFFYSSTAIELTLTLFILCSAWCLSNLAESSLLIAALILCLVAPLWLVCRRRWPATTTRTVIYTVSVLVVYGFMSSIDNRPVFNLLIDGYLVCLLLALLLAIRMTREELFRLDTHDYLVFTLLLVLPVFPFEQLNDESLARLVLRWALLIYSCEFLLSNKMRGNIWLDSVGITSLVVLVVSLLNISGYSLNI